MKTNFTEGLKHCEKCDVTYAEGLDSEECFHNWTPVKGSSWKPKGWRMNQ